MLSKIMVSALVIAALLAGTAGGAKDVGTPSPTQSVQAGQLQTPPKDLAAGAPGKEPEAVNGLTTGKHDSGALDFTKLIPATLPRSAVYRQEGWCLWDSSHPGFARRACG